MFCMKCGQELPAQAKYCFNCGNRVEAEEESAKSIASQEGSLRESGTMNNNAVSLLEFRQNAPSMTGFRDELISYRKILSNSWDYNAYVGILLGVGGPKHGDAACMNYAIGQGDNGNNTKKTLEAKGLMPVFEKYKGKKIDEAVMLSDVEDEIIAVAPEYAQIRQKLFEITMKDVHLSISQTIKKLSDIEQDKCNDSNIRKQTDNVTNLNAQENVAVIDEKEIIAERYRKIPCHKVFYSFPGIRSLTDRLNHDFELASSQMLVQEYNGDLYYARKSEESLEFHKIAIRGNSTSTVIGKFRRISKCYLDGEERDNEIFHLGTNPRFCISEGRIYFSRPHLEGRVIDNNQILSLDISNPADIRKEFELIDTKKDKTLYNPYVVGDKVLVIAFSESGCGSMSRYLLDKKGSAKCVSKYACQYLSINEDQFITDSDTNTAVYNFISDEKMSIKNAYKGAKNNDVLFIDAKRDILYYLASKEDIYGEIIGITRSGEIVDQWKPIKDRDFLKLAERATGYSSFSFDGNLRVFKITAMMEKTDEEAFYVDCIYAVNREGECEERFRHQYYHVDDRFFGSILHIQTPNTVIVHFEQGNESPQNRFSEYMITTTGDRLCKPLFS